VAVAVVAVAVASAAAAAAAAAVATEMALVHTDVAAIAAASGPGGMKPTSPFEALGLSLPLLRALVDEAYATPTPIQTGAIPHLLDGRDLLGQAQTGTGKTAAFILPILQRLASVPRTGKVRALVVAPTRELAAQIAERAGAYGRHLQLRHAVVYGGVSLRRDELSLRARPDLLVATPGRLLDLLQRGDVRLDSVEVLVLDEADRMLDMGFLPDVRRILAATSGRRQTLLFSATMPPAIKRLADDMLKQPIEIAVTPNAPAAETVEQAVFHVEQSGKRGVLEQILREDQRADRVMVFTRTKHGANRLSEQLTRAGFDAAAIHGNKSQNARERALSSFRAGTLRVLVATDLASRGIDVEQVQLVVNYDLPEVAESYVHRIGRTGRAGASGRAVAFCDPSERPLLEAIERLMKRRVSVIGPAPAPTTTTTTTAAAPASRRPRFRGTRRYS